MLAALTYGTSVQLSGGGFTGRSRSEVSAGREVNVEYKQASGKPLRHIGQSLTEPNEHFVLLFNQMLASGHHSDYDART